MRPLSTEVLLIGSAVELRAGAASPVIGVPAPLGSIYYRLGTTEQWQKTGAGDTDWTQLVFNNGTVVIATIVAAPWPAAMEQRVTVADARVTPASIILASWGAADDLLENGSNMDSVSFQTVASDGSFDILINCPQPIGGSFTLNYWIGA